MAHHLTSLPHQRSVHGRRPVADGRNHGIRMYEPEPDILDGTWTFPKIVPQQDDVRVTARPLTCR